MKQLIRTVIVFLIGLITASIAAYIYFDMTSAPKEVEKLTPVSLTGEEEAFITALSGEVFILRDDSILTAETGDPLYAGDILKVVDESFCQIQFSTVASARLRSNTIVRIKKLLNIDDSPDIRTEILTGSMLYRVNKLREGEKLEVKSEDKIYSVRGTTFLVDRNSEGTYLIVDEGLIAVTVEGSSEPPVETPAGKELYIPAEETSGQPVPLSDISRKRMEESENMAVLQFGPDAQRLVKTGVETIPSDAQIYVNGILSGKGTYTGLFPAGEELTFLIRKRGYEDKVLSVKSVSDLLYRISLDPQQTDESTLKDERELSSEEGSEEKLRIELESRTARLKELEELILELKNRNYELEAQSADSENRMRKMTARIQELEQQKTDLTSEIGELKRKLAESAAREDKLRELIKQIQEISATDSQ